MSMNDSKKSATMSFRLDLDVLDKLKKESDKQDISLNVLANRIFKRYVEWDMFEPKVGMIPIARPILDALFQKFTEKEIIDLAHTMGHNIVKNIATFMKGEMNVDSFMAWFETRMKMSDFELNHAEQNGNQTYIVKHDLGTNWSLYHKTVLELIFHDVFEKPIQVETNESLIKINFSS